MTLEELVKQLDTDIENFEEDYYYLTVDKLLSYIKQLSYKLSNLEQ